MDAKKEFEFIALYLAQESNAGEQENLDKWRKENRENTEILRKAEKIWHLPDPQRHTWDKDEIWNNISERTSPRKKMWVIKREFSFIQLARIAAVLILCLSASYFVKTLYTIYGPEGDPEFIDVAVGRKAIYNITLEEGTKVTLDSGSSFSYPEKFAGDKREVYIRGEGYFEVALDDKKEFILHANGALVKVVGTSFGVSAWPENDIVNVFVVEGRVTLTSENEAFGKVLLLKSGQSGEINRNEKTLNVSAENAEKYLSWLDHSINFENITLRQICNKLERWYDIDINIYDPEIENMRLTVNTPDTSLTNVLDLIVFLTGKEYELSQQIVVIK